MRSPAVIRLLLEIFIGIPAMVGLYFFIRWLGYHHETFLFGLLCGMMFTAGGFWFIERYDPESYYAKRDRRLNQRY